MKLNQTDYLVELKKTDNPTIFAIELRSVHKWLGIDLNIDVHIGTKDTLRKVSQECEKACKIMNTGMASDSKQGKTIPPSKLSSWGIIEGEIVKKVLLSKEKKMQCRRCLNEEKIEQLDRATKDSIASASILNIKGKISKPLLQGL